MDTFAHAHLMIGCVQKQRLRAFAADRGVSMSALVREAIEHYLRVVAGPSPQEVRLAARSAAGCLPPDPPVTGPSWRTGGLSTLPAE